MELFSLLKNNKDELYRYFDNSADLYYKEFSLSGFKCGIILFEDLASVRDVQELFIKPIYQINGNKTQEELAYYLLYNSDIIVSPQLINSFEETVKMMSSGFAVAFFDGYDKAISIPVQNVPSRSIDKPTNENNLRASKESFTDTVRKNMSLIRRRIRSSNLIMESMNIGSSTNTEIIICYHKDYCPYKLYSQVKERLNKVDISMLLDSGYLTPFIDKTRFSLFSSVGYTEKPDTLCAKICEGKICIIVDGTPYALIYPYFFHENFNSNDDYVQRPYFSSLIRIIRYISFIISISLPGIYVAVSSYTPQMFTDKMLYNIYSSQNATPLPIFAEAIMINILLEAVKEAGLRIPEPIGNSLSLLSALIIGEAAVKAGIVGNVVLIVCALSMVTTFIIPSFYEEIFFIRFIYILSAGLFGIPGISIATIVLFINISNIDYSGIEINKLYNLKTFINDGILKGSERNKKHNFNLKNAERK